MNKNRVRLRNRQKKYELIFQGLATAVVVFHKTAWDKSRRLVDLTIVDVNDAFEIISGFKKKEIIGKTLQGLLPRWSEQIGPYVQDFSQQGEIAIEEPSLTRWYLVRSFSIDKDCLVTSFEDITAQKKIETVLKKTNRSLFALIGSLPGFAYRCLYDKYWTMLYLTPMPRWAQQSMKHLQK